MLDEMDENALYDSREIDSWLRDTMFDPPKGGEFIVPAAETFASVERSLSRDEAEMHQSTLRQNWTDRQQENSGDRDRRERLEERIAEVAINGEDGSALVKAILDLRNPT